MRRGSEWRGVDGVLGVRWTFAHVDPRYGRRRRVTWRRAAAQPLGASNREPEADALLELARRLLEVACGEGSHEELSGRLHELIEASGLGRDDVSEAIDIAQAVLRGQP